MRGIIDIDGGTVIAIAVQDRNRTISPQQFYWNLFREPRPAPFRRGFFGFCVDIFNYGRRGLLIGFMEECGLRFGPLDDSGAWRFATKRSW